MSPMRDLQLVIFDCDGVLVDSEVISNEVLARALTAEGLPTPLEARRDYQGLLMVDIDSRAQARLGRPLANDSLERYERDRAEAFHRELQAEPGAAEAVERVNAAGIAVCVASPSRDPPRSDDRVQRAPSRTAGRGTSHPVCHDARMRGWRRACVQWSRTFAERRRTASLLILAASVVLGAYVGDVIAKSGTAHPFELSRAFWVACGACIVGVAFGTARARRRRRS